MEKQTEIKEITETVTGIPVKNVKWNSIDNVYTGLVKCPVWGNEKLHDGYVSCVWRRNGSVVLKKTTVPRPELKLKLE